MFWDAEGTHPTRPDGNLGQGGATIMKILKLVCLGIMAGVVFAGTAHIPGAYAQEVAGA